MNSKSDSTGDYMLVRTATMDQLVTRLDTISDTLLKLLDATVKQPQSDVIQPQKTVLDTQRNASDAKHEKGPSLATRERIRTSKPFALPSKPVSNFKAVRTKKTPVYHQMSESYSAAPSEQEDPEPAPVEYPDDPVDFVVKKLE